MALKSSNKIDTNTYEVEVTVDADVFTEACKSAYLKQRKSIQIPGFRKGKATQGMVERFTAKVLFMRKLLKSYILMLYRRLLMPQVLKL